MTPSHSRGKTVGRRASRESGTFRAVPVAMIFGNNSAFALSGRGARAFLALVGTIALVGGCQNNESGEKVVCQTYACENAYFRFDEPLPIGNYSLEVVTPDGTTSCQFSMVDASSVADSYCAGDDDPECAMELEGQRRVTDVDCSPGSTLVITAWSVEVEGTPSEASLSIDSGENCQISVTLSDPVYPSNQAYECDICDEATALVDTASCVPSRGMGGAGGSN